MGCGRGAELVRRFLGRNDVDHHTGATLETSHGDEFRPDVNVPVERTVVLVGRGVHDQIERHVAEPGIEDADGVTKPPADSGDRYGILVLNMYAVLPRDDEQLVR